MKRCTGILMMLMCVATFAFSAPASAHHSFSMFDKSRTLSINGSLYAVEWQNPHSWIWVQATGPDGVTAVWWFEGGSPAMLTRMGYSKKNMLVGTKVTVTYNPLKDGRTGGSLVTMKFP